MTTTPKEQTARLAETIAYLNRWLAERGYTIVASDRLTALVDDHVPSGGEGMDGYSYVTCSCGWESYDSVHWSDHLRAALEAAEKGARG